MSSDSDAAAEERRKRAQARKDKIASRGADRLAKITGAARGDGEAGERFGTGGQQSNRPASPAATSSAASRHQHARASALHDPSDDPPDVDISSSTGSLTQPGGGGGGFDPFGAGVGGFPSTNADGSMPDMLQALLGGGGGGADGASPFPEGFAQMFGGGANGGAGAGVFKVEPPRRRTWTDRLLPLVHLISMVSLAFWAVFVLEPRIRQGYDVLLSSFLSRRDFFSTSQIDWNGWAALGRGKQALHDSSGFSKGVESAWEASGRGVATVQLLYLFLTLELMLQGAAILIFKTRPPIPSLLNSVMPYLPPNLAAYAHTGIKYWSLLGQLVDDLAVLVLSVVAFILYAEWSQLGPEGGKLKLA